MTRKFDAIVIGTGQAGPSMAGRLTGAGMSVAIIERDLVGGTCVNTGCKPTKTLVASAYAAHLARRGADFGVMTGDIQIDMKRVHARSQKISIDKPSEHGVVVAKHGALHADLWPRAF
jgi:pyruvate/2-oxoglutarate dehydrogenase complex dihydrolipoamide dehydrogenase (E3) component